MDDYGMGKSAMLFFAIFLLVVFVFIGIFIWIVNAFRNRKRSHKRCPFCAGVIPFEEFVCRFCNRELT